MAKNNPTGVQLDFEKALLKGYTAYDRRVGQWWVEQSLDTAHQDAYKVIAAYGMKVMKQKSRSPRVIVDYACGPGWLLLQLAKRYPGAVIVGLDGSKVLLREAALRLTERHIPVSHARGASAFKPGAPGVRLVQTPLPNFSLPQSVADLILFSFPNILTKPDDQPYYDQHGYQNRYDNPMAQALAAYDDEAEDQQCRDGVDEIFEQLLTQKVISKHIAQLLKPGGYCIRADYAEAPRPGLKECALMQLDFQQGALGKKIFGRRAVQHFTLVDTAYKRSGVLEDVFHQTKHKNDDGGGYILSALKKRRNNL